MFIDDSIMLRDECTTKYLSDVRKFKVMTNDEFERHFFKYKEGDKRSYDSIINGNLRFVISVAKQYQKRGVPLCDLIAAGNVGLMYSLTQYDITLGYKFTTFAIHWIRSYVLSCITEYNNMMKLSTKMTRNIVGKNDYDFSYSVIKPDIRSMNELLGNGSDSDSDILESTIMCKDDWSNPESSFTHDNIKRAVKMLPDMDRRIIEFSFGMSDYTCGVDTFCDMLGIDRYILKKRKNRAIRKIKNKILL